MADRPRIATAAITAKHKTCGKNGSLTPNTTEAKLPAAMVYATMAPYVPKIWMPSTTLPTLEPKARPAATGKRIRTGVAMSVSTNRACVSSTRADTTVISNSPRPTPTEPSTYGTPNMPTPTIIPTRVANAAKRGRRFFIRVRDR